jgi:hypothetical protein
MYRDESCHLVSFVRFSCAVHIVTEAHNVFMNNTLAAALTSSSVAFSLPNLILFLCYPKIKCVLRDNSDAVS